MRVEWRGGEGREGRGWRSLEEPGQHPPTLVLEECVWSSWSSWTRCSCQVLVQQRYRHQGPAPAAGRAGEGSACTRLDGHFRPCPTANCSGEAPREREARQLSPGRASWLLSMPPGPQSRCPCSPRPLPSAAQLLVRLTPSSSRVPLLLSPPGSAVISPTWELQALSPRTCTRGTDLPTSCGSHPPASHPPTPGASGRPLAPRRPHPPRSHLALRAPTIMTLPRGHPGGRVGA